MGPGQTTSVSVTASPSGGGSTFESGGLQIDSAIELSTLRHRLEEENTILYDGSVSRTRTQYTEDSVEIDREIRLKKPYRQKKRLEELTVGHLFMNAYNRVNGASYLIANADDCTDHHLVCKHQDGSCVLKVQLVK